MGFFHVYSGVPGYNEHLVTRKPTLQDIGRRLGVSSTTVSLALRNHPRIPESTRIKVRKLIEELNYQPDPVARALVSGRSNLIGVIVPNSSDAYYAEVFKGTEDAVRAANFHVLLANGSYDMESYAQRVKEMMSLRVGGIMAAPPLTRQRFALPPFWQELRGRNFPVVLVNRQLKPAIFPQVSADYGRGVELVVEYLASLGHRRVGFLSGEPALLPIRQRTAAFRKLSRQHGFDQNHDLFQSSPLTSAGGYETCARWWHTIEKKPTAIVTFSDTVAVGVLRYLQDQRLRVPKDISLISFDGIAVSEFTNPSIATVKTPMYDIGKRAFELLLAAMNGRHEDAQDVLLPVELLKRESVGPAVNR
jgi:LacI family transcriptional regulator